MCLLFETVRLVDGEPRNLAMHDDRMNRSRGALFGSTDLLKLSDHIAVPASARRGIVRCRVLYASSITTIEFSPYVPTDIRTLKLVDAGSVVYDHKFVDRSGLTALIDRKTTDDVLMLRNGCITDVSFANIVFTDGHRWTTPDTPLLRGTMRELLLRNGVISEGRITIDDLSLFTHFRLINAMLGFDAPPLPVRCII